MRRDWSLMAHGFVNLIADRQTGRRGSDKVFTESMAMLMGQRPLGPGTLGARAMLSLDPTMGKRGLSARLPDRRDGRRPDASRRPPAPARPVHGALDVVQRPARRARLGVRLPRLARRAGARPAGLHAPLLGHAQSRGAAHPPLARFDAHHVRRRDARREPRAVAARGLVVQRPRARPVSLEHRDAQARFVVNAAVVQPAARAVDAGQLRRPEKPRAARTRHAHPAHDGVAHRAPEDRGRPVGDDGGVRQQPQERARRACHRAGLAARIDLGRWRHAYVLRPGRTGEDERAVRRRRAVARRGVRGPQAGARATSSTSRGPDRCAGVSAAWSAFSMHPAASIRRTASTRARTSSSCRADRESRTGSPITDLYRPVKLDSRPIATIVDTSPALGQHGADR